jgi:hypothetical protein
MIESSSSHLPRRLLACILVYLLVMHREVAGKIGSRTVIVGAGTYTLDIDEP